jgi:hypothetical protein
MKWILDFLPWWAPWVAIAIALAATTPYWLPFWNLLPRSVKIAIIAVSGGIALYFAGRNTGAANEKERQKNAEAKAIETRRKVDARVEGLSDDDVQKELKRWTRKSD